MTNKKLHIVSFDVPYPPKYGGVIDVFYKIKALHKLGIVIYLHTYDNGTGEQRTLNNYCDQIFYYPRTLSISKAFSRIPFSVKTRSSEDLVINLNKIDAPILFEGLHTTFPLLKEPFKNRKLLFRAHNIEHNYYEGLASSETSKRKKIFYKTESKKLKKFEKVINNADHILAISPFEYNYFNKTYTVNSNYVPAFHQNSIVSKLSDYGDYAFYHGDLRIADNIKAARYLIRIFSKLTHNLIIAGGTINDLLIDEISNYDQIKFEKIQSNEHLIKLLNNAHINVLPTFQKTGIKLKLINTLFNSRFCLVNNEMIEDTGLEELCVVSNSIESFRNKIEVLFKTNYSEKQRIVRIETLKKFDNSANAQLIVELLD